MDIFFNYYEPASGKNFVGLKNEVNSLANLLQSGQSVALFGEPKTGKKSLARQVFTTLALRGAGQTIVEVDMMRTRTTEDILLKYATSVLRAYAQSVSEYQGLVKQYLGEAGISFNLDAFMAERDFLDCERGFTAEDVQTILFLPRALAKRFSLKIIVYFKEFQNISFASMEYQMLKTLETMVAKTDDRCTFVFYGSMMNAMKDIFAVRKFFWKDVLLFPIPRLSASDIADYVYKGIQSRGRVIEKEVVYEVADALRYNMYYINHVFSIVEGQAIGYANKTVVFTAVRNLMAIHSARFFAQITDLTDFQINLLRAVMDGEVKFSAAPVIEKYRLNSSANVKRLKDALIKKEVLWFDEKDEPHVQDPLFEMWLREEYFGKIGK